MLSVRDTWMHRLEIARATGRRVLGVGEPVAVVHLDAVDFLWHLSGRYGDPALDIEGDASVATAVLAARVVF